MQRLGLLCISRPKSKKRTNKKIYFNSIYYKLKYKLSNVMEGSHGIDEIGKTQKAVRTG